MKNAWNAHIRLSRFADHTNNVYTVYCDFYFTRNFDCVCPANSPVYTCVQDILQNDRINLDDNFKFSFVKEIIKVSSIFASCINHAAKK